MTDTKTVSGILEHIFDQMPEEGGPMQYSFYPLRDGWEGPAELYFTDPNGACWRIKAERHVHG